MNKNISKLNIKEIYAHQLFNKDVLLMKRESNGRHHFSFGEYYDEILLSGYPIGIQSYMLPIHQIIVFLLITKSTVKLYNEHTGSKSNQIGRLSAKFGLFTRQATGRQPLVQITHRNNRQIHATCSRASWIICLSRSSVNGRIRNLPIWKDRTTWLSTPFPI